jgi:lipopolysaccharide transport system ATP-binding protein
MSEVSRGGRTVLFVSHNMAAVENLCQRCIVLHKGHLVFEGTPRDSIHHYLGINTAKVGQSENSIEFEHAPNRKSPQGKLLQRAELFTSGDEPVYDGVPIGARLKIKIYFDLPRATDSFNIGIGFNNNFGARVLTVNSCFEPDRLPEARSGRQVFVCDIPSLTLVPGEYTTFLWLDISNTKADAIEDAIPIIVTEADYYGTGKVSWRGSFVLPQRWHLEAAEVASPSDVETVQPAG